MHTKSKGIKMNTPFYKKTYKMSICEANDKLTINKNFATDWIEISMFINGIKDSEITIRSKEMVEQLHFTLSQLLEKN